jgi:hypothetical protein
VKAYGRGRYKFECCDLRNGCTSGKTNKPAIRQLKKYARKQGKRVVEGKGWQDK